MKKYFKYFLMAVLTVVFIGTFVYLWRKSRPETVRYEQLVPEQRDIRRTTVVTGSIVPRDEVNIVPQISGIISELYKEAGEQVKEQEIIAKVKVIPDMGSLSSAESRVRLADINLKQARTNYDREKSLHDQHLVSDDEFDQIRQALDQAQEEYDASVEALEVVRDGVSSANASSSSTLIRSTITGLILDIPVKVGNSVIQTNTMNDGTTIATVANMDDLIFDGMIDETEVGRLVEGMPMTITIGALQDFRFEAVLEYISPKAKENNGTNEFEIKAAVKVPPTAVIRSGYSANAEIVIESADSVLAVRESTIEFDGDSTYVYVMGSDSTYVRKPVKTGLSDGLYIEVKSGVTPSDRIRGNRIYKTE